MKKFLTVLFASSIVVSTVFNGNFIYAAEDNCGDFYEKVNYASGGTASASTSPVSYWGPDKLVDGIINRDASKPEQSRWSSEAGAPGWIKVDLKEEKTFSEFFVAFENDKVRKFHIEVSNDDVTYTSVYTSLDKTEGQAMDTTVVLEEAVKARYVKLTVDALVSGAYPSVSLYEFSVYGDSDNFYHNFAVDATVEASDQEASTVGAKNVNDGIFKTRWGSGTAHGQKWMTFTFDEVKTIKSLILEWERCNATGYSIQAEIDGKWQTLRTFGKPRLFTDKINLKEAVQTNKIRILINDFINDAPNREGKNISYPSVSLHEVQLYDKDLKVPPVSVSDIANDVQTQTILPGDTKLEMPEVPEGYSIEFLGADYEQILARDMTIRNPLTTKDVVVNFRVTEEATKEYADTPAIKVSVPGLNDEKDSINDKPTVLPELQQWFGYEGEFELSDTSKIVVDPAADLFMETAETFAADYKDVLNKEITVERGTNPQKGDFYFTMSPKTLDKETYVMDIQDYVTIEASEETGAYWSTRSILQILKQTNSTIHKGKTMDYPKYEVRGMMLDVARKSFSMDFLEELVKTYSWYKLNEFHLHLNDNVFTAVDINGVKTPEYSGFRLESDFPNLTNDDTFYTKEEFNTFILDSKKLGVNITPEFDTPGHSGAFTRARPDIARGNEAEYLDVENPDTIAFVKDVFREYTSGEDPVYPEGTVVHVGTDEYKRGNKEAFRKYQDDLLTFMRDEQGYTPRVWGSQTENNGTTPITVEGVQMNLWYTGYANPKTMYDLGYDLINTNDGDLYIVPGAGYYYDYLNQNHIYSSWQPNKVGGFTIPVGSEQMLGSTFAVWNDKTGPTLDNGTTDQEVFDRIYAILPTFGAKLWGDIQDYTVNDINALNEKVNYAPNSNPRYEVDSLGSQILDYNFNNEKGQDLSGNKYDLNDQKNVSYEAGIHRNALTLQGGSSFVQTPVEDLGYNSTLDFWVKRDKNSGDEEQVLFESDNGAIKAVQKETGKLGFSRDIRDYSFNYELPKDEWVHVRMESQFTKTLLYVNDEHVDTLAKDATGGKWATLIMPLKRIGSETSAFKGQIDDVSVFKKAPHAIAKATSEESQDKAANAVDGNASTIWHTKWSGEDTLPQSITLELPQSTEIKGFTYLPRQTGSNGMIKKYVLETSLDGTTFKKIAEGDWEETATLKQVDFEVLEAKYVRLTAIEGVGGYASAAEINVITKENMTLNKRALNEAILDAEDMIASGKYTPNTTAVLQSVVNDAKNILNIAVEQKELDDACAKVDVAINAMVMMADKAPLSALIEQVKSIDFDRYTEVTKKELLEALENAENVLLDQNATQEIVDTAKDRLATAIENLVLEDATFVKTILKGAIDKANIAESTGQLEVLAPAVKNFIIQARNSAVSVYNNVDATITECIEAWLDLANAMQYMDFKADKDALIMLIELCEDIDTTVYTDESVLKFTAALEEAKATYADDGALQTRIDAAYANLETARNSLVKKDEVDKLPLETMIQIINEKIGDGEKYKKDGNWDKLQETLKNANDVIAKNDATQEEINTAMAELASAYENIRLLPDEEQLAQLKDFIRIVDHLNRALFTKSQLVQIDETYKDVANSINDFDSHEFLSLQEKMEQTLSLINEVESLAIFKDVVPSDENKNSDTVLKTPTNNTTKPATSDSTNTVGMACLLMASGYSVYLIRKKRK